MKTFIIEHLEPELGEWALIEYRHISEIVGKENLWFTNIKNNQDIKLLEKLGKVFSQSARELALKDACILDPEASQTLTPENSENFSYFIFGGILGDYPPKKRTNNSLTRFLPIHSFNIGKSQMSTDNAVYVVKKIAEGTPLDKMPFKENVEIRLNSIESTILPYKYALIKNKPLISKELIKYLKEH